jgi:hypothetical protein
LKGLNKWVKRLNILTHSNGIKEREEEKKKDRIKDMHPLILNMIWMASPMELDHISEFCNLFKSFYNSKNQDYANLELHNQFDNKALHNVGFAEGTVLALWSGLLKRSNSTAPSNCTPFAFKELTPINMNQKSCSLIITMINQKRGLISDLGQNKSRGQARHHSPKQLPQDGIPTKSLTHPPGDVIRQ